MSQAPLAALLRGVPALAHLGMDALKSLETGAQEVRFATGEVIVREGDVDDRAFLIAEGSAEVTSAGRGGPVLLAALSPGELFGERAIFSDSRRRLATVAATSPARLFSIDGATVRALVARNPEVRRQFADAAEMMRRTQFIKLAANPFAELPLDRVRELASRLQPLSVPAGATILSQGEEGDRCFIVRAGQVEVTVATDGGGDRRLATLGPEAIFGEAALLTAAPRNSTVKAVEDCDLLALLRRDLMEVLGRDPEASGNLRELLKLRARPRRAPNVLAVTNTSQTGETITILKDPARRAYYRLSPQGWFIWQRLNGERGLKDLTLDYMKEFKAFAPAAVSDIVSGLTRAGFAETPQLRPDLAETSARPGPWRRFLSGSRRILEFQVALRSVDGAFDRLYKSGVYLLFTPVAQTALALVALAGVVAFFGLGPEMGRAARDTNPWLLACLFPAQVFALLAHEAGHAFTTKAIGREVHGVGVGWYWFGLVAFVDTTDSWLGTRRQRVAVSFAGPYVNLVLGGALALAAFAGPPGVARWLLWQSALVAYMGFVLNFNPLLEYDGYYILADVLDRPNLRRQALRWLGSGLLPALTRNRRALREHLLDVLFGLGCVLYALGMAVGSFIVCRVFLQGWLAKVIPAPLAALFAWVVVAGVAIFSIANLVGDIKYRPEDG